MDPLDFLTNEELIRFFHCKKTEMSCMEQPNIFLNQLRDHDLVPEKLYKTVIRMRCKERKVNGVYEILDRLEKERSNSVKLFWRCVFHDHILQKYPVLRVLRNSLMDGSFRFYEKLRDAEDEKDSPKSKENTATRKKRGQKRKKTDEETEEEDHPSPSSLSTPNQKKTTRKLIFSSPVKKGEKLDIWTWAIYKTQLPVTCGDKKATLHRDKMAKGGACIFSQDQWFTPTGFEEFAGKGSCKNWKLSIRCQNTPLHKLIMDGHLTWPHRKRSCAQKSLRKICLPSTSESSSTSICLSSSSESSSPMSSEEMEKSPREEEEEEEEEYENEEETEGGEAGDLSKFQTPTLPVSCGSLHGVLFKNRFASGMRSKSIRTEEGWFTPQEFVKQDLTVPDGYWRRDINCHGKTLNFLLQKILKVHSMLCLCSLCKPTEQQQLDQDNDDVCFICNSDGDLVCCDECPRAFHHHCHLPALQDETLGETWLCTYCVLKKSQSWWHHCNMTEEEALNKRVQSYMMYCQYLMLCMYKGDSQCVFIEDPSKTVQRYRSFISHPMWLDRVKKKLLSNEYETLRQFVSDVRLIFQNCNTFNKGNHVIISMGSTLSQMFEQEFKTIFNIP